MLQGKILRVARPTDRLDRVVHFYTEGLGLQIIDHFENHEGFDGVMIGIPGENHHFEFTHHQGHTVGRAPTQDNLIVFYLPNQAEWQQVVERMKAIHQSSDITGQPVPKGEEIASLSYNYVFRVMTPTGTFQPVALSSIVKHLYLVKEVRLTQQALKTLARKTLPEQSEDDYV